MQPDRARFVSEYDSKAEKEVVARGSTEQMTAKPAPKELPTSSAPTPVPPEPVASRTQEKPNSSVAVDPSAAARADEVQELFQVAA